MSSEEAQALKCPLLPPPLAFTEGILCFIIYREKCWFALLMGNFWQLIQEAEEGNNSISVIFQE